MKKKIKNFVGSVSSIFNYPILVNSYGRSGSTVLAKSIISASLVSKNRTVKKFTYPSMFQQAWNLEVEELKKGILYKTHDYPPERKLENDIRMLYTFADPIDVVLSLIRLNKEREEKWMQQHCEHLGVPYDNFQEIIDKDSLHLNDHLESWLAEERFPIAFIKYEEMWNHQEEIAEFLNFQIDLPEYRARNAAKIDDASLLSKLEQTYSSLRNKISQLDSFFINNLQTE